MPKGKEGREGVPKHAIVRWCPARETHEGRRTSNNIQLPQQTNNNTKISVPQIPYFGIRPTGDAMRAKNIRVRPSPAKRPTSRRRRSRSMPKSKYRRGRCPSVQASARSNTPRKVRQECNSTRQPGSSRTNRGIHSITWPVYSRPCRCP